MHTMCTRSSRLASLTVVLLLASSSTSCTICGDAVATFNEDKFALAGGNGGGSITCKSLNDLALLNPELSDEACEASFGIYALECECSNLIDDNFVCNICPGGAPLKDPELEISFPEGTCGGFEATGNLLGTSLAERQEQCDNAQRLAPICCDNVEPFCTLCPSGQAITKPDVVVLNFGITCAELDIVTPAFRDPTQCLNAKLSGTTTDSSPGCDCEFLEDPFGTPTPSSNPSSQPSEAPSTTITQQPSSSPSTIPSNFSRQPSFEPTGTLSGQPSGQPSRLLSALPSELPSELRSAQPSVVPSKSPSLVPTGIPSLSAAPTGYVVPQRKTRAPTLFGTGDREYGGGGRGGAGGASSRNDGARRLLRREANQ